MHIWLFHPIFVHLTAGLLITCIILFLIGFAAKEKPWSVQCLMVARWNFWLGILAIIFTGATGLLAYFTAPYTTEKSHDAMNNHLIAAVITAISYLLLAFWLWQRQIKQMEFNRLWLIGLVGASCLLIITGFLGGRLVFVHGVGVAAVPKVIAGSK